MNPISARLVTGTIGELLVQLRLFQYDVQAAPPLKDSGNDLIAVRGATFRAIQVRTIGGDKKHWRKPQNREYHILALVRLHGENDQLELDPTEIYLVPREVIEGGPYDLREYQISQHLIDCLIPRT